MAEKVFKCARQLEFIKADSLEKAEEEFECFGCPMNALKRCSGPILADVTAQAPVQPVKRRGRPPKAKVGQASSAARAVTDVILDGPTNEEVERTEREEKCRAALRALALPWRPDYAELIAPFLDEIRAARAVGRGWRAISGVLRKYGYNVGYWALRNVMSKTPSEAQS